MKALAIEYRPKTFDDVVEQDSTKIILQTQIDTGTFKHAYLFCGGAGTGKTTCARIFANELNKGQGNPIELDAASNNSVDDVRDITQQSKTQSLDSEYKVYIIDECHALSNSAWQAMLKLIEEPPAKAVFIFCTTDPQKIPKTIISRVQRYDFKRLSHQGIIDRLQYIFLEEMKDATDYLYDKEALDCIAKLAEGGMRDAITLLDKCLSYSKELTIENVTKALGTVDYSIMVKLTEALVRFKGVDAITIIEDIHNNGKDLKQFVRQYVQFLLDIEKYGVGCEWTMLTLPKLSELVDWFDALETNDYEIVLELLSVFVNLNHDIKYSQTVKTDIVCAIMLWGVR